MRIKSLAQGENILMLRFEPFMLYVFMLCLGLLKDNLFISNIILHHAQCFQSVGFPNSMFTPFINERAMCSLEK